jgi:hypothetical protein
MLTLGLALLLAGGCRLAPQTAATGAGGEANAQQQAQFQEMLDYLKQNNQSFEDMKQQLQQMRAQQDDPSGVRALGEDVLVAKALVNRARKAAADKKAPETEVFLERLVPALISLRASLPAAKVAEAVERATAALNSLQTDEAVKVASRDLLQAKDICVSAPPTLSPNVLKDLEGAKNQVDKADVSGASSALPAILKTLGNDEAVRAAAQALAAARGAQDALGQGAWGVVIAEFDYLDGLLATLSQKVEGASTAAAGEQPPATAGGGEAKPEAQPAPPPQPAAPTAEAQPARGAAPATEGRTPAAPAPAGAATGRETAPAAAGGTR